MSGRFVRASNRNAWDTNLVKVWSQQVNPEYLSVNWEASGGGAFAVIPLGEKGKLPDVIPLFRGHTAAVLDTDWCARDPWSASEDGKIMIWEVPQGFTLFTDAEEPTDVAPVSKLTGHSRKVGQVLFNPAAENILASASGDFSIKIWDVGTGSAVHALKHPDIVQSLSWNANGTMLVTTSRDKKLRVWDVRQERPAHEGPGHEGAKNSRTVWLGEHNRFATTGFSRMSDRQLALWEPGNNTPIVNNILDSISGVCMPFWDDACNCLYLAGKGDGNIRYFEYENDKFEFLSEYKSIEPQRGIAFLPKRGVNVHENEVMRAYKTVNDTYIEPISFTVPRRAETFQSDIFPPASGAKPGVSASEWLSGKTGLPPKIDFESIYEGNAPVEVPADYQPPAPAPAPAAAPKPAPKKEPEPAPAASRSSPPSMKEQKGSMAAIASKYEDEAEADDDETSSFEEISKPTQRSAIPARSEPAASSPTKTTSAPPPKVAPAIKSPVHASSPATAAPVSASSNSPTAGPGVETTLEEIKQLIETQTKMISVQGQKISHLTDEVDSLKKRVGSGSQDQSERIRQLELELEEYRS
ncbi:hypothetical protein Daesc_005219 [Daldinia eschscholtzii]|uniref:Coronin n=1 Tax=Daldinia eschscholtzii TaxID=292717 RepID=A0AAX6ML69_9PEZI